MITIESLQDAFARSFQSGGYIKNMQDGGRGSFGRIGDKVDQGVSNFRSTVGNAAQKVTNAGQAVGSAVKSAGERIGEEGRKVVGAVGDAVKTVDYKWYPGIDVRPGEEMPDVKIPNRWPDEIDNEEDEAAKRQGAIDRLHQAEKEKREGFTALDIDLSDIDDKALADQKSGTDSGNGIPRGPMVDPKDRAYQNMYNTYSNKQPRQYKRGKINNALSVGQNDWQRRQTVRAIKNGMEERPTDYKAVSRSRRSARNGGIMMRTFLSAMRRGGRLVGRYQGGGGVGRFDPNSLSDEELMDWARAMSLLAERDAYRKGLGSSYERQLGYGYVGSKDDFMKEYEEGYQRGLNEYRDKYGEEPMFARLSVPEGTDPEYGFVAFPRTFTEIYGVDPSRIVGLGLHRMPNGME